MAPGEDLAPIRTKCDGEHLVRMPRQLADKLPRLAFPQLRCSLRAAGEYFAAVGADSGRIGWPLAYLNRFSQRLLCLDIPQAGRAIVAPRKHGMTVIIKGNAGHQFFVLE